MDYAISRSKVKEIIPSANPSAGFGTQRTALVHYLFNFWEKGNHKKIMAVWVNSGLTEGMINVLA
jgi:hypothetical protein